MIGRMVMRCERGRGGESFKESEMLKVVALSDFEGGGGW